MAVTYTVKSFSELQRHLEKLLKLKQQRVREAAEKTARFAAVRIIELVPKAFTDLAHSVHVEGSSAIVDAPHAAAVEIGSRPHTPPLEPLIKWVKLRGAQGLGPAGRPIGRRIARRNSDLMHARIVALTIRALNKGKKSYDVNTPERIARSIQKGIMISGTKPHFFVKSAMPSIEAEFLKNIKEEIYKAESI